MCIALLYDYIMVSIIGMTLLAIGCSSALEEGLPDQIKYLIEKKGADPCLKDVNDNTMVQTISIL